jgi:hypothetical protein
MDLYELVALRGSGTKATREEGYKEICSHISTLMLISCLHQAIIIFNCWAAGVRLNLQTYY